jgi:23S rRNA (cytidine1920-2'-O)/16S rRNA (cytidine1409-2'-O)-methyltransferase
LLSHDCRTLRYMGCMNGLAKNKLRLDEALVERGLAPTRSQARDMIRRGCVRVDGAATDKPALLVDGATILEVEAGAQPYASRGGLKLAAALDAFAFDPQGRIALDIGASTGGFTDVLLQRGAARVFAVDIGTGQLHPRIAADPRVVLLEGRDARLITPECLAPSPGAIVADVSFVSLTKVLGAAVSLAAPGAFLVALVKPQFEVGRAEIGKGGIVRDPSARQRAVAAVRAWIASQPGWRVVGAIPSPITGGSGNVEYLIGARRYA